MSLVDQHTQRGEEFAERLVRAHTSPSVAFFLKLPRPQLKATTLGSMLLDLAHEMGIAAFDSKFFSAVKRHARRQHSCLLDDGFFEFAYKKKEAIEKFKKTLAQRREKSAGDPFAYMGAFMPFFVQFLKPKPTKDEARKPHSGSLFFAFSNYELGVRTCLDILRFGFTREEGGSQVTSQFSQLYEIRVPDTFAPGGPDHDRLGYMLVDWEVEESELKAEDGSQRLSRYEVEQLKGQFPLWFYRQLLGACAVRANDVISMVFKEKSRNLANGNRKHSMHLMVEVCAAPGSTLSAVFSAALKPFLEKLRKKPKFSAFTDEDLKAEHACVIGVDPQPLWGSTPIAMLFSCKQQGDPQPCLTGRHFFSQGGYHIFPVGCQVDNPAPFDPAPVSGQHLLAGMSHVEAAQLLAHSSCSIPTHYITPVCDKYKEKGVEKTQRYRASASPATGVSGGPPGAARGGPSISSLRLPLPKWYRDQLDLKPGYSERRESALMYAEMLPRLDLPIQDNRLSDWHFAHIDNGAALCPTRLSKRLSEKHYHSHNGVIVACHPQMAGAVLARCTACTEKDYTNEHCERVFLKNQNPTAWIKFDEDGFDALTSTQGRRKIQKLISDDLEKKGKQLSKIKQQGKS